MLNDGMKSCNSEEWATPQDFYDRLNEEFHFTLDPCSTDENAKCEKHYTKEQDGLAQDWTGETVFCNPPYGKTISAWCKKCYEHSLHGGVCVMLVHARTDTAWFHDWVYGKAEIRFVRGRLHFNGSKWNAPFPSLVAIYKPAKDRKDLVLCKDCKWHTMRGKMLLCTAQDKPHTYNWYCADGERNPTQTNAKNNALDVR